MTISMMVILTAPWGARIPSAYLEISKLKLIYIHMACSMHIAKA